MRVVAQAATYHLIVESSWRLNAFVNKNVCVREEASLNLDLSVAGGHAIKHYEKAPRIASIE